MGWGHLSSHWCWGEQEWQRNLKQNHCFAGSGSDPSSVIVQENSWSVAWTNASLLNISLRLTELPFSQDWDTVAKRGLVQRIYSVNFHNVTILISEREDWYFDVKFELIFNSFCRCSISSRFWTGECKGENTCDYILKHFTVVSFFCLLFQPYAD